MKLVAKIVLVLVVLLVLVVAAVAFYLDAIAKGAIETACETSGLSRSRLYSLLKKYGISKAD